MKSNQLLNLIFAIAALFMVVVAAAEKAADGLPKLRVGKCHKPAMKLDNHRL